MFLSLQDAALANVHPLPHEVPLPPSLPPPQTLDDEVAFFTSKPLSVMPCDVPLPPTPPPADAVLPMAHTLEKKYPDLKNIRFPSLDDEVACLMSKPPNLLPHEVPLPPSPPPADSVFHVGHFHKKKHPDRSYIGFHSLAEDDELKRPSLLPHEVPLPPSPLPADAAPHVYTLEKKHMGLTGFPFLDVDTEIVPKPLSGIACVVPLSPTPPPAATLLHMVHTTEKKCPDLRNLGVPSLDDEVACLMSKQLNIMACDVPVPPSPSLVQTTHLAKKYID